MAFNNASLGHVHAMAHQLGGFYDLPHGECNAILLPHVQRANLNARLERYVDMARFLGENVDGLSARAAAEKCLDAIKQLSIDIGIPAGLVALGKRYGKEVRKEDIAIMTGNAQKDACGLTNPTKLRDADVAAIYEAAL
jgi:alcohol dehydrogenase